MSASAYKTREDIANRALQHCRMKRIVSLVPPDSNANAQETAFVYDKLREAELRNNVWRFAIRRVILRALGTTTLLWTPPTYAAGTSYSIGSVVVDASGDWWQSKTAANLANTPAMGAFWAHYFGPDSCDPYATTAKFSAGELTSSGGVVYLSLVSANADTPPTVKWLAVNGTTAVIQILYPVGAGPVRELTTSNVFRLPHGFLRRAPQEPRAGVAPYLGAPSGPSPEDWLLENDYIVTTETGPIMLRFVADVVDVPDMDAMFCEMHAASMAEAVAPILVADPKLLTVVLGNVQRHHRTERIRAIQVNGIETGTEDPPEDDYVTCRI